MSALGNPDANNTYTQRDQALILLSRTNGGMMG
jgi:hypothetical protein